MRSIGKTSTSTSSRPTCTIDAIIEADKLRAELIHRFDIADNKRVVTYPRKRAVTPV